MPNVSTYTLRQIQRSLLPARLQTVSNRSLAAIGAALLALAGAAAGSYVTYRFDEMKWSRDIRYSIRKARYDTRMQLIERTVRAMNDAEVAAVMSKTIDARMKGLQIGDRDTLKTFISEIQSAVLKQHEIGTEYATVLTLDALYFGPKTKEAVLKLKQNNPWWTSPPADREALVDAMFHEVLHEL